MDSFTKLLKNLFTIYDDKRNMLNQQQFWLSIIRTDQPAREAGILIQLRQTPTRSSEWICEEFRVRKQPMRAFYIALDVLHFNVDMKMANRIWQKYYSRYFGDTFQVLFEYLAELADWAIGSDKWKCGVYRHDMNIGDI